MVRVFLVFATLAASLPAAAVTFAAERPNVVWIVSEDNSKHYLKLFDEQGAKTPHIEKLAQQGLVFEHAFSCSPVCSVARTTLATGVYAPQFGGQYHRRLAPATLPADWHLFPWYLRQAGYYTTNNAKTDYNVRADKEVWDESSRQASWRNRSAEQPFFHMESHAASHESSLHFGPGWQSRPTTTDPQSVTVWPYFPDTELFRYTTARYHDRIGAIDRIVGETVARLEADGLLEDTFVFYFGDHGGVLPGSKGYVYERGVHVPLVVRVPEKWKHLVHDSMALGSRVDGFVSFVDFGPTLLHLAGIEVPRHMHGRPFLGGDIDREELDRRQEAFSYADRFDEKYDLVRGLRQGKLKYLRNYQAFYPDALQNNYRYKMLAYQQWRALHKRAMLKADQEQFFRRRPAEALYDLSNDPHELHNLADDPRYAKDLASMRSRLQEIVKGLPDLSFFPESTLVEHLDHPVEFGRQNQQLIAKLVETADLALLPWEQARAALQQAVAAEHPAVRYWALIALSTFGSEAEGLVDEVRPRLSDEDLLVRMRAAEFLAIIRAEEPQAVIMQVLQQSDSHAEALLTLNTVVYLRDTLDYEFSIAADDVKAIGPEVKRRLEYLSAE
jgi:arylsulfatase A-like enzyme